MHNNIDTIIKEKLEHVTVDSSYMMQDFDAIANLLPTPPVTGAGTAATAVSKSPWWFSVNTWIATIIITAVAVSTVFLIKNKNKNFQKSNTTNIQPIAANIVDSDTPVVVSEIPKDPKTAPKKWVYRMKLNFDGKNSTTLPPKKYIDLSDIKSTDNDINQKDNIEKGKTTIQAFTSKLANPSQVFTINNQKAHNITCKNGTSLQIKPNTFVKSKNETVQGNVQLELKEAYSFTDMVANNLHTVSNGSLLQSGGMIYVNASQEMQQLGIDIKNPIQLTMPTSNRLNDMLLFYLDKNNNWIANRKWQNKLLGNNKNYYYDIRNLDWISSSMFNKSTNTIDFLIENSNSNMPQAAFLIFPKRKGVIIGDININNISFSNIPLNEPAVFVAFKYTKDKVLTCTQQLTTSKEPAKAEDFIELSPEQVKAKLDALGTVQ